MIMDMNREYIAPAAMLVEAAVRTVICQSVQQYIIAGDIFDNDSD